MLFMMSVKRKSDKKANLSIYQSIHPSIQLTIHPSIQVELIPPIFPSRSFTSLSTHRKGATKQASPSGPYHLHGCVNERHSNVRLSQIHVVTGVKRHAVAGVGRLHQAAQAGREQKTFLFASVCIFIHHLTGGKKEKQPRSFSTWAVWAWRG